jgi:DNA-binding MarR family transcriptional regulator
MVLRLPLRRCYGWRVAKARGPSLTYVIGRVDQGVRREMRARLAPFGLSVSEYTALSIIDAVGGLSNAQLARRSLITPPAMLEVLASLERRGLVERHSDPGHGRIRRAELTEEGARTLRASARDVDRLAEELLAAIPDADRETVRLGLVAMMDRLTSGLDEDQPSSSSGGSVTP